jgi:aspartyl-tRNA(Asn)/glutamyl-tRNA(Gln) amidotransferase subunit A
MCSRRDVLAAGLGFAATAFAQSSTPTDLAGLSLKQVADLLRQKRVTSTELTRLCLDRIAKYNPVYRAFITVVADSAMATAKDRDEQMRRGQLLGPLHGVPIALKDNIDTAGIRTTGGSAVFADRVPTVDAPVAAKLKAAGSVLLGKLNLHEFAAGGTSVISYFGPVRNPWNPDFAPGGSSGGSAAAIAADLCYGTLGTDTGGSIRTPSAYCSTVGFKPTYGRVSNRGVIPLTWSLDHVGPIAKTVEDAAILLGIIAGYDDDDISTVDVPVQDYRAAIGRETKTFRLGIPRAMFYDRLDPDHERAIADAIGVLRKLTVSISDVTLPHVSDFGGLRGESYAYHRDLLANNANKYQQPTRRGFQNSEKALASEYVLAWRELQHVRREVRKVFQDVDILVTPTTPRPPYTVDESIRRADMERLPPLLSNTGPFDVYGLPTISVPGGFTKSGLPIGLQLSGAPWAESTVLSIAHAYQQATDWHLKKPQLKEEPIPHVG